MKESEPEILFALLGERWRIANELLKKQYTVINLAHQLSLRPDQVSHHLQVMRHAGIVQFEHNKRSNIYRLTNSTAFIYVMENLEKMREQRQRQTN